MKVYLHGVSIRKVDDLVKALGADTGISCLWDWLLVGTELGSDWLRSMPLPRLGMKPSGRR
jgi:hypothetical protein